MITMVNISIETICLWSYIDNLSCKKLDLYFLLVHEDYSKQIDKFDDWLAGR